MWRFRHFLLFLFCIAYPIFGQDGEVFYDTRADYAFGLMVSSETLNDPAYADQFADFKDFVKKLEEKRLRIKNDTRFIQKLFYKVHRKYLKNYKKYSDFESLLINGDYDCVTGTALYALLLEKFGFDIDIWETTYHTYLTVNLEGNDKILLESTDPLNGFVTGSEEIAALISTFQSASGANDEEYTPVTVTQKIIELERLPGLLYFNVSVGLYNQYQPARALEKIHKGLDIYPSERLKYFNDFLEEIAAKHVARNSNP